MNEDTLAFEVVKEVGPGGNYVSEEHTIAHMTTEFFYPRLAVRCNFDLWEERGRPDMLSRAREMVETTLEHGRASRLDPELILRLKKTFPEIVKI